MALENEENVYYKRSGIVYFQPLCQQEIRDFGVFARGKVLNVPRTLFISMATCL